MAAQKECSWAESTDEQTVASLVCRRAATTACSMAGWWAQTKAAQTVVKKDGCSVETMGAKTAA